MFNEIKCHGDGKRPREVHLNSYFYKMALQMGFPLLHYAHQAIRFLVTCNAESMAPSRTCRHFLSFCMLLCLTFTNIYQVSLSASCTMWCHWHIQKQAVIEAICPMFGQFGVFPSPNSLLRLFFKSCCACCLKSGWLVLRLVRTLAHILQPIAAWLAAVAWRTSHSPGSIRTEHIF